MEKAADLISLNTHDILNEWEEVVKREIEASKKTEPLILRNLLPSILKNISIIMKRLEGQNGQLDYDKCREIIDQSIDHGRHRATSKNYTVKQVIQEFMVLNRVLTNLLIKEAAYTTEVGIILSYALETAMAYSTKSFDESLQEMREKLIGTLTHDIRNPVSAAYLSVSLINAENDEKQNNKLRDLARDSLRKSLDLMEGLLDAITVKAGEGILLHFGKGDLLADLKREHAESEALFSQPIIFKSTEDKIEGVFDGSAIRRVLENLITNAAKYGAPNKPISISVADEGEEVSISVHNHGNFISEKEQDEIFDFMARATNNSTALESWGIGLSFVKMAAEAHKGYVKIKSSPEDGTTFTIVLHKFSNEPGKVRTRLNYKV